jgi:hypothetical protein
LLTGPGIVHAAGGDATQNSAIEKPENIANGTQSKGRNGSGSGENHVYTVFVVNDNSWHFWLPLVFTAAVAIGGFVSVGLLFRQTKASMQAANAAMLSAKAVLNGERAWLVVKFRPLKLNTYRDRLRIEGERAARELMLEIKNVGRTAAQVKSISARAVLLEYGSPAREDPKYAQEQEPTVRLLVPEESAEHFVSVETEYSMTELAQRMTQGQFSIFVYGYVCYSDVYNRHHRSNIGLRRRLKWENGFLGATVVDDQFGSSEYNAAT